MRRMPSPPRPGVGTQAGARFACDGGRSGMQRAHPSMPRYSNLNGDSGVVAYETTADSITLAFVGGERYVYTHERPGRDAVDRMKALAKDGRGLATFVSQHVRDDYARKL